jgi:hypothetical protein
MTSYSEDAPLRESAFEREQVSERVTRYDASSAEGSSIAQLLGDIVADAQLLMRKEFELAREEIKGEIDKARTGAISLGVGAGIAAVGALLLVLALVHGLAALFEMPLWASYLIVGALLAIGGGIALSAGINRVKTIDPMPRQAIDSVRKDVETVLSSDNEAR